MNTSYGDQAVPGQPVRSSGAPLLNLPGLVLVTPALADANNGNWRTACRWAQFLGDEFDVGITNRWEGGPESIMVALHARHSATSVTAWRARRGPAPLVVVLTGTDLYRDLHGGPAERAATLQSLALADRLVVLNEMGPLALPHELWHKVTVCLQSTPPRRAVPKPTQHLRALMVGHLRPEKAPDTYFAAARLLAHRADILLDHIGGALDPALGAQAAALQAECPNYRWLGALPHDQTRRHIRAASVLVHPSRMEGGAQAIIEATTSGTPVLASRIDGNLGLLGAEHPGGFEPGDASSLAALLVRARDDVAFLPALRAAGDRRASRFSPTRERRTLLELVRQTRDRALENVDVLKAE